MANEDNIQSGLKQFEADIINKLQVFLIRVGQKISQDASRIIQQNKKVARGELKNNITYEIEKTAEKMMAVIGVNKNVKSKEGFQYGLAVHEGTKPHFPPVEPLTKWVIQKGLVKKGKRVTTFRSAKGTNLEALARGIAFVIARKISKTGTKGVPFLKLSLAQNLGFIQGELNRINI